MADTPPKMAPNATTVPAAWSGPYVGETAPGQPNLEPGDVVEVSPELLESGHWTAVESTPSPQQSRPPGGPVQPAPVTTATESAS